MAEDGTGIAGVDGLAPELGAALPALTEGGGVALTDLLAPFGAAVSGLADKLIASVDGLLLTGCCLFKKGSPDWRGLDACGVDVDSGSIAPRELSDLSMELK